MPVRKDARSSVFLKANSIAGSKMGGSVPAWSAATCASIVMTCWRCSTRCQTSATEPFNGGLRAAFSSRVSREYCEL